MILFDVLGFIFGLAGAILVGQKIKWGFLAFMLHSSCYSVIALADNRPGLLTTCIIFFIIDLYYLRRWWMDEIRSKLILELLHNPPQPNEKLKDLLQLDWEQVSRNINQGYEDSQ